MAHYFLKNCKLLAGGYDLSTDGNRMELAYGCDSKEDTTFGSNTHVKMCGLATAAFSMDGFWHADSVAPKKIDDVLVALHGLSDQVVTIAPTTGLVGEPCFFQNGVLLDLQRFGAVGENVPVKFSGEASSERLVKGTLVSVGALAATGSGTAYELGAVAADKYVYAVMHIIAVAGSSPTITMIVQSDDAQGFASPTTRLSFTQQNAIGGWWAVKLAGPVTDTWWRASYTIGGTGGPSFTTRLAVGIL